MVGLGLRNRLLAITMPVNYNSKRSTQQPTSTRRFGDAVKCFPLNNGKCAPMRRTTALIVLLVAPCLLTQAQNNNNNGNNNVPVESYQVPTATLPAGGGYGGYGGGYGYGGWGYGRGSSTAQGSIMHGMADYVRAAGYNHLLNSEATINLEKAESMDLNNRLQYTNTYYERKRIRREAQEYEHTPVTPEQLHRVAQLQLPHRLDETKFNFQNGKIDWPIALEQPLMNGTRRRIEQVLAEKTPDGRLSGKSYMEISHLLDTLDRQLNDELKLDTIPVQAASQAKAFLKSLSYELSLTAQ